ncbi:MAG TPA: homocysteine S-methyltransferase family protein [Armatimonadota bacterium]|jgi:methionine synthase I (cobalamin-dependent)
MNALIEQLLTHSPVVTDGAWGTELQARGLPIGASPDPWNIEQPDKVEAVARAYAEAGSRIILTNTFGATRISLARYGLGGKASEINREGARISRRAAGDGVLVFGSMGPMGAMLAMGEVSEAEVVASFEEQATALAEGGAHGLVIETMSDLVEASIAVAAAKKTGLPVVGCMAFGAGKDGARTMMGVTPEQAAEALERAGADVIGANCGPSADIMRGICGRLKAATTLPIWMKPNAGAPQLVDGKAVCPMTAAEFVSESLAMVDAGASFIGGCCGSTPEFIRALATALSSKDRTE